MLLEIDYDAVLRETDSAYLLDLGDDEVWLPKSLATDLDREEGTVMVPEWWAIKEGLV